MAGTPMIIKAKVRAIGQAFVHGLRQILANKLYGLYVYGAAAFPEDVLTGDIDFHVILTNQLTNYQRSRIEKLHHALARDFPSLGGDMDGYYILLADAGCTSPPQSQMWSRATDASWVLGPAPRAHPSWTLHYLPRTRPEGDLPARCMVRD